MGRTPPATNHDVEHDRADRRRSRPLWERRDQLWKLPAGVVDDGETVEPAAAREQLEETGWRAGALHSLITEDDVESGRREWVDPAKVPGMVSKGKVGARPRLPHCCSV